MPLDPIGFVICNVMQRHTAELLAMSTQGAQKLDKYLLGVNKYLGHFVQLWSECDDNTLSDRVLELRTPLNSIIGYTMLMQDKIAPPVVEEIAIRLRYLELGGEILLYKTNELVDRLRNKNLLQLQHGASKGIDVESQDMIDKLIDTVLDLRLLPAKRTDEQQLVLQELHTALLNLNLYWQVLDTEEIETLHILCSLAELIYRLSKFLTLNYTSESAVNILQRLETLSQILATRTRYLSDQAFVPYRPF